jgi:phosphomevalonate kinase
VIARAPGKLVLAGAYAVLEGAPAWVAAVDRYVVADTARPAELVTPEVREGLRDLPWAQPPWFDASALRDAGGQRKLGLGSSAAILVASLAALELEGGQLGDEALATAVFDRALSAHRVAQGGGSGIDVAASAFGGVLRFQRARDGERPLVAPRALPPLLEIAVWSSPQASSTAAMLARVATLREARDAGYRSSVARLASASEACDRATTADDWIAICLEQLAGLRELGDSAGIPIVTSEMCAFHDAVGGSGVVVLPSGAGGGDVILVVSRGPAPPHVERVGRGLGLLPVGLSLGARGVHALAGSTASSHRIVRSRVT